MSLISCPIPEGFNASLFEHCKNIAVMDGRVLFDGYTEGEAAEILNKAVEREKNHIVKAKAAIRAANSSEVEQIRGHVSPDEEVDKYLVVEMEATRSTPDTSGERIVKSFQEAVMVPQYKEGRAFAFQHEHRLSYGKTFDAYTEEIAEGTRLMVKAYIPNNFGTLPNGESVERNIKAGIYDRVTVSWFPTRNTVRVDEVGEKMILTNYYEGGEMPQVIELSLVAMGMHPDAKLVKKSFDFKDENQKTIEMVKYKSLTGEEKELTAEKAAEHIQGLEKALENQKAQLKELNDKINEVKSPVIDRIQNLEADLGLKQLTPEDLEADFNKRKGQSLEALQDRVAELEAMAKATKKGIQTPAPEPKPEGKKVNW